MFWYERSRPVGALIPFIIFEINQIHSLLVWLEPAGIPHLPLLQTLLSSPFISKESHLPFVSFVVHLPSPFTFLQ
jgi:hypothetical protein